MTEKADGKAFSGLLERKIDMQFDAHILALQLKKLRNKRNIIQEHLAEMADLSTVYISYAM